VGAVEADGHRDVKRRVQRALKRFGVRRGSARQQRLRKRQGVGACLLVVVAAGPEVRRAGLVVPALELRQVDAGSVGHRRDEVVAGDGLAVMALEVEVHAAPESLLADQRFDHPHHFGALVINGAGVEVVDLDIRVGAHRMRHRAGVLGELHGAQGAHFANAGDRATVHVGAEFLVAIDGQPFLQRQLEPVATGDAVAGPVVEVLVRDDAVDVLVVGVGGRVGARQDVLGVENVQALVFHRPHVEVADGDDHVVVEIAFQAEDFLVPAHRTLECVDGVRALVELAGLDEYGKLDAAPAAGGEFVAQHVEARGDQRKEIAGLGEGVFPFCPVPAVSLVATAGRIAVGEQHGQAGLVGVQGDLVARHDVGTIGEPGDAAESLRLALREIAVFRAIKPGEAAVVVGVDAHLCGQRQRVRRIVDGQRRARAAVVVGAKRRAVDGQRDRFQPLAIELQRRWLGRRRWVAPQLQLTADQDLASVEMHVQFDAVDEEGRGCVVLAVDSLRSFAVHRGLLFCRLVRQ